MLSDSVTPHRHSSRVRPPAHSKVSIPSVEHLLCAGTSAGHGGYSGGPRTEPHPHGAYVLVWEGDTNIRHQEGAGVLKKNRARAGKEESRSEGLFATGRGEQARFGEVTFVVPSTKARSKSGEYWVEAGGGFQGEGTEGSIWLSCPRKGLRRPQGQSGASKRKAAERRGRRGSGAPPLSQ